MQGNGAGRDTGTASVFYRLVKTDPPTLDDFLSNEAKGRTLKNPTPETMRRWSGVSAYLTPDAARATAHDFPRLGRYIAELRVTASDPIQFVMWPDSDDGHLTLWGDPDVLLRCVSSVFPVDGEIT